MNNDTDNVRIVSCPSCSTPHVAFSDGELIECSCGLYLSGNLVQPRFDEDLCIEEINHG